MRRDRPRGRKKMADQIEEETIDLDQLEEMEEEIIVIESLSEGVDLEGLPEDQEVALVEEVSGDGTLHNLKTLTGCLMVITNSNLEANIMMMEVRNLFVEKEVVWASRYMKFFFLMALLCWDKYNLIYTIFILILANSNMLKNICLILQTHVW